MVESSIQRGDVAGGTQTYNGRLFGLIPATGHVNGAFAVHDRKRISRNFPKSFGRATD
jgi:hypothetical protein